MATSTGNPILDQLLYGSPPAAPLMTPQMPAQAATPAPMPAGPLPPTPEEIMAEQPPTPPDDMGYQRPRGKELLALILPALGDYIAHRKARRSGRDQSTPGAEAVNQFLARRELYRRDENTRWQGEYERQLARFNQQRKPQDP